MFFASGCTGQGTRTSPIRPFTEDDIAQVADLNWKVLRGGHGAAPPELRSYFRELFFHNPWSDGDLPSLVYQDRSGKIIGFLGVVPRRMSVQGRSIQVAFGSNFVVHPDSRSTLAGLHLVKRFMSGKQDLSMGDSVNDPSRKVWTGLGGSLAWLYSLHWSRPLRPSRYAVYVFSRLKPNRLSAFLSVAARPFCGVLDGIAVRMPRSPLLQSTTTISAQELDVEALLGCLSTFSGSYSLRPEYDKRSLSWLLDFMGRMKARGDLRKLVLRDEEQEVVGWYVYYIKQGGISEVVQVGAAKNSTSKVLDHLFYDAWRHGAIGLHGRLEPRLMQVLADKHCFFYRRGAWMQVHSRKSGLLQLIHSGDAFLTRLEGEWCLAFGG